MFYTDSNSTATLWTARLSSLCIYVVSAPGRPI